MAQTLPILICFVICLYNCKIFTNYHPETVAVVSPLVSSQIIKLAMYFLLIDMKLIPRKFRKIHHIPQGIYECVFGIFMTETTLFCLWFPLEKFILTLIPRYMRIIYSRSAKNGIIRRIIENFCNNSFLMAVSYAISILILACIMHSTRAIDFRLIRECGIKSFLDDAAFRLKRGTLRVLTSLKIYKGRSPYSVKSKCSRVRRCK